MESSYSSQFYFYEIKHQSLCVFLQIRVKQFNVLSYFVWCFHVICFSSLALPVTLECLDGNARMNSNISRYTLPLGVVFNKDGAAIYQVMVVVFFAKYRGINPDVWDLFIMG